LVVVSIFVTGEAEDVAVKAALVPQEFILDSDSSDHKALRSGIHEEWFIKVVEVCGWQTRLTRRSVRLFVLVASQGWADR
jgi:hypothetical protein